MNKRIYQWASRLVVLAIACMAVSTFVACGDDNDDEDSIEAEERYAAIFGSWENTWQDVDGVEHFVRYTFRKDGTGNYSTGYVKGGLAVWGEIKYQADLVLKEGSFFGEIVYHNKGKESDIPTKISWYMYVSDDKLYIKKDYNYTVYYRIN